MGAKSGQRKQPAGGKPAAKRAGAKRLALVVFGALFVILFAGLAIAYGRLGDPSIPSGDVALVEDTPNGTAHLSEAELKRAILQQASRSETKKVPKAGTKKYEELQNAAAEEKLTAIWITSEAEERDITVTEKQVENELKNVKKQNFPTEKAYQEFLKTSHFTQEDVNELLEAQLLSTKLQEAVQAEAEPATNSEIADYYEAEKAEKFTEPPTRDVRVIVNKDKAEVEKAKEALEADSSPASWKKVAAQYSSDPSTKSKGGLQKAIPEELLQGALKKAIYESEKGELVGPTSFQGQYLLTEVAEVNPEKVKSLGEVRSEISTTLTQEKQQTHLTEFGEAWESKWRARTFCAASIESDQLAKRCSNFQGSGRPAGASPACYEANPKTPATECPAPVEQTKPALPGSVSVLKLGGEPFVQRPRPYVEGKGGKESSSPGNSEALEKAIEEAGE